MYPTPNIPIFNACFSVFNNLYAPTLHSFFRSTSLGTFCASSNIKISPISTLVLRTISMSYALRHLSKLLTSTFRLDGGHPAFISMELRPNYSNNFASPISIVDLVTFIGRTIALTSLLSVSSLLSSNS